MEQEEISLIELFDIIKKHLNLIVLTTVATTVIAAIYTFFLVTPMYQSSTEMIVTHSTDTNTPSFTQSDINTSISLINTYEDIIRNDVILDPVIESLNLEMTTGDLRETVTVQSDSSSQVFSIQVQNKNPYNAAEIANRIATIFQDEIFEIMDVDNVTVISAAIPNTEPASPNNILNIILDMLLGSLIGIGLVFIREMTDNTVKNSTYMEEATGWTTLGHVNSFTKNGLVVKTPLPKTQTSPTGNSKIQSQEMKRTRRRV